MIIIRSPADINTAKMPKHLSEYVSKLLAGIMRSIPDFNEDDGQIVVITSEDEDDSLCKQLGTRYSDNVFEGVAHIQEYRCFHLVYMTNNQYTVSMVIPDESWLDPKIRNRVINEMS